MSYVFGLYVVSLDSGVKGSRAIRRLRSKVGRCIGQSVRHIGFFWNRALCITIVAFCEASFVVRKEAGPLIVPSMICAVNREQEGGEGRCRRCMQAASDWVPRNDRILFLGSCRMTRPWTMAHRLLSANGVSIRYCDWLYSGFVSISVIFLAEMSTSLFAAGIGVREWIPSRVRCLELGENCMFHVDTCSRYFWAAFRSSQPW